MGVCVGPTTQSRIKDGCVCVGPTTQSRIEDGCVCRTGVCVGPTTQCRIEDGCVCRSHHQCPPPMVAVRRKRVESVRAGSLPSPSLPSSPTPGPLGPLFSCYDMKCQGVPQEWRCLLVILVNPPKEDLYIRECDLLLYIGSSRRPIKQLSFCK